MHILHVANFHQTKYGKLFYCTDQKISNGLIRAGHFVYNFSYRDVARFESRIRSQRLGMSKMNSCLLKVCEEIEPDIVLLGKAELLSLETLRIIRKSFPNTKIALWHFDAIYNEREIGYISSQLNHVDAAFLTTGGEGLETLRCRHGSKVFFFPNPVDESVEILKNFQADTFNFDVMYCGRDRHRPFRRKYLQKLIQKSHGQIRFSLNGVLGNPLKFGKEYYDILRQSAMGLNLSDRFDVEYYSSDRVAQLTGNGVCTFSPRVPKFELIYSPEEIVYFDNQDDLFEKLLHYKKHHSERKKIAEAGWKRAHYDYSSTRVAQYFIDTILGGDLSRYHWATY